MYSCCRVGAHIAVLAENWGARTPGEAEYAPVESDLPTLILAGEMDQNTPAYWSKLAGETLSNSHYLEFPGMGHGVIRQGACSAAVIGAFLQEPEQRPDDSCVRAIDAPQFYVPPSD